MLCDCLHQHLPRKLVLAKTQYIASDFSHYLALIFSSAVLQNVLDDIVAILVLNKRNHTDSSLNVRTPPGASEVTSNMQPGVRIFI